MRIFFDNCTSPVLATTLDGFVSHRDHRAVHIKDLPCGRHAADVDWMAYLAADANDWTVVTGDGRIARNRVERAAYRQAGLRGFALEPAFQKIPLHQQASLLLWRWPDMEKLLTLVGGPAIFKLPVGRGSRIVPMPL